MIELVTLDQQRGVVLTKFAPVLACASLIPAHLRQRIVGIDATL